MIPAKMQPFAVAPVSLWMTSRPSQTTQAQHGDDKLKRGCSAPKPRGGNSDKKGPKSRFRLASRVGQSTLKVPLMGRGREEGGEKTVLLPATL